MKIKVDLPHCPQVSIVRLSSSFHFLPRPISLADGNEIINNPWFQISCSEKWWKLYFATKFYLCVSFLGFAIIAINLAKLPQEGNCSNRLLWRATLKGKKREKKSYSTLSMIWLATVMMSFPFFHNITNPSSLSTMHGSLKICFWRNILLAQILTM